MLLYVFVFSVCVGIIVVNDDKSRVGGSKWSRRAFCSPCPPFRRYSFTVDCSAQYFYLSRLDIGVVFSGGSPSVASVSFSSKCGMLRALTHPHPGPRPLLQLVRRVSRGKGLGR